MRRSWSDRVTMTAVFCANGLAFGALAGNLPRLRDLGDLSPSQLGIALLAMSLGATLMMPVTGRLAPRMGAATLALIGAVAAGFLVALPALILQAHGGYALLLLGFAALGMAAGTTDVAMNARGSEIERGWGAPIMSSFHAGWSVGGLTGAGLAAGFAHAGASAAAALGAAGALSVLLSLSARRLRRGEQRAAGRAPPLRLRLTLPSRGIAGLCVITALCFSMEGAMADWVGVYLRQMLGASQAMAGGAYSGFALTMAAGRLTGDRIVRRYGPARTLLAGGALAAFGIAVGLSLSSPLAAATSFALVGFGLANVVPVAFSAAGARGGSTAIGAIATTGYLGLMAGPPLLGFAAQATSLATALCYVLVGAVAIAGLSRSVR